MNLDNFLSIIETAKTLKKDPETIRRWIRMNKIKYIKVGNKYYISKSEIYKIFEEK